ncbi:MAG: hypothetical protein JNJ49_11610 [Bdellovibrionaceae bacterium]|nr:hypothetical protein [Pseudobdellovibrionaceae bacterium]
MTRSKKTSIIVAVFVLAAVGAGIAGYLLRERTRATINEIASLSVTANETRQDLLSLYRSRLDRAKALLEVLEAPAIKPEWANTQNWRAETAADLAALDQQQTAISSHLASVISQTEPLAKPELTFPKDSPLGKRVEKARAAFRDYEKFEQDIVRKRRFYFDLAQRHETLRQHVGLAERPAELPLFPAEKALLKKE